MLSNHLLLCRPLLLLPSIFPSVRVFSNESSLCMNSVQRQKKNSFALLNGHRIIHSLSVIEGHVTCRNVGWYESPWPGDPRSSGGVFLIRVGDTQRVDLIHICWLEASVSDGLSSSSCVLHSYRPPPPPFVHCLRWTTGSKSVLVTTMTVILWVYLWAPGSLRTCGVGPSEMHTAVELVVWLTKQKRHLEYFLFLL